MSWSHYCELLSISDKDKRHFTKAILFAKVPFELITKEDRMRTCYMQACLTYVNFEGISNSDIRKIFGLGEKEKATQIPEDMSYEKGVKFFTIEGPNKEKIEFSQYL